MANLGVHQVQRMNSSGNVLGTFGKRGNADSNFHGCCNPVTVLPMPDGNILAVEKEPSRVMVLTSSGQLLTVFQGLHELVKGCNQVAAAVDSKGQVYLGVNAGRDPYVLPYKPKS